MLTLQIGGKVIMISKWNYQPLTLAQKEEADRMSVKCGGLAPIAELLVMAQKKSEEICGPDYESKFSPKPFDN